jgi:hypothetical protein
MTEAEWGSCTNPSAMLRFLKGKASERKLRLFAVACCRAVDAIMADERCRGLVECAERRSDGSVGADEWAAAQATSRAAVRAAPHLLASHGGGAPADDPSAVRLWAAFAAACSVADPAEEAPTFFALQAAMNAHLAAQAGAGGAKAAKWSPTQVGFIRDLFGNPWRPCQAIRPEWAAWNDGCVVKLAKAIYDERRFGDLPVLADALEDAGCTDAELLGHLRSPGPHVLGCWATDVILGRS